MNLIESIFRGGLALRADASGTPAPFDDFWYQPIGGHASSAGMRVSPETSKRLGTVIACVSYRGKMVATLPCKVRRDLPGGGSEVLPTHPWYRALYLRPNPVQTSYDFRYMMNAHVDLRGNAYALKVVGPGKRELWPLHPDRVSVQVIESGASQGLPVYKYDNPLTKKTDTYGREQIFHLRDWSDNMWVGQSRITMALDPLGVALARQDFLARFMKNDTRTGSAIVGTNFKTEEDAEAFGKKVQRMQTGENRGKTLILPVGLDVKQMGVTPVDAQLIEGKKASDTEICSIFGVLPHAVGVDAGKAATFASTEQFNIMNAQQCVHPMLVMWEQCIQRDLLDDEEDDSYAKFSMAALLRGDNATRFAGYAIALGSTGPAWMLPDEVRELEDENPMANGIGQVAWRPMNMAPLSQTEAPENDVNNGDVNDDDAGNDGAGGDAGARAQALVVAEMLAMGAAERCVRREVSGVKRLMERQRTQGRAQLVDVLNFYSEHAQFIADAFHLDSAAAMKARRACDERCAHVCALLMEYEGLSGAQAWLDRVAATEAKNLVGLVMEGVR